MKSTLWAMVLTLLFCGCKNEIENNFVTLQGKIRDPNSDSIVVAQSKILKTISLNPDGSFLDTLNVATDYYILFDGKESVSVYLKNGYQLNLKVNAKDFNNTLNFKGKGAKTNNYLIKKKLLKKKLFNYDSLFQLNSQEFTQELNTKINAFTRLLNQTPQLDSVFVSSEITKIEELKTKTNKLYAQKQRLLSLNAKAAPLFVDYENHAGGSTSLKDLRGQYVYIDLWATWCGPCKKEIPFLKSIENQYHNKNIAFISISLDRKNAYSTWRNMVKKENLGGIQLYAKQDRSFTQSYFVTSIPRFILIDPLGNTIEADAPRPSSPELITLLNSLNI